MGNCLFINSPTRNIAKEIMAVLREGLEQVAIETTRDNWYPKDNRPVIKRIYKKIEDELDALIRHGFVKANCNPRDVNEQLRHLIAYEAGNVIMFCILQTRITLGTRLATIAAFNNNQPV